MLKKHVKRIHTRLFSALLFVGMLFGSFIVMPANAFAQDPIADAVRRSFEDGMIGQRQRQTDLTAILEYQTLSRYEDDLELPVNGATGYAVTRVQVVGDSGKVLDQLRPGDAFCIIEKDNKRFLIKTVTGTIGYVPVRNVFINLPDVIPSIVYYDVNSDVSMFRSSGYEIPGVTGFTLYDTYWQNDRFGREEYAMPALYQVAVDIARVQKECIAHGECLKIYQSFRPYGTQRQVADALTQLVKSNADVAAGIRACGYNTGFFIALGRSNHQYGLAIDVSLCEILDAEILQTGDYSYLHVDDYKEYAMPSAMHELSARAAVYSPPVQSMSKTSWQKGRLRPEMTEAAIRLQSYFTNEGFVPLSSEWWHFDDMNAVESVGYVGNGEFYLSGCVSAAPASR